MKRVYYQLLDSYDWWIYLRAYKSLARMSVKSPGFSYLLQLHLEECNSRQALSPSCKSAARCFHDSLKTAEKS